MQDKLAARIENQKTSRRTALRTAGLVATGAWIHGQAAGASRSPNARLNWACIGVGGKGSSDTSQAAQYGDVVALCDVDSKRLDRQVQEYPQAARFDDFRELFDRMGHRIDAVTVSTPDHTHAVIAGRALQLKKHCFVQKPLCHNIYECQRLTELALSSGVMTQMGNQGTADDGFRTNVEILRSGVIGQVRNVHVWTNRPVWPQGLSRPSPAAVPGNLNWDSWLGPAPYRPYANGYHSFTWRGWWDFGNGAFDMAAHVLNLPFYALGLNNIESVSAETSGHNRDSYPESSEVQIRFAGNARRDAVTIHWYDGGWLPDESLTRQLPSEDRAKIDAQRRGRRKTHGVIFEGTEGLLYVRSDYGTEYTLLPESKFVNYQPPTPILQRPKGAGQSDAHFGEFVAAIYGDGLPTSSIPDVAAPLEEITQVAKLAVWAGGTLQWDAAQRRVVNRPDLDRLIRPAYRHGYEF